MRKNKIYNALIRNYTIFSLILGIIFSCVYLYLYLQSNDIKSDTVQKVQAGVLARPDYTAIESDEVESFGGWIEVLDENLKVVYTKGTAHGEVRQYTEKQLIELMYDDAASSEPVYRSLAPFTTGEGKPYHLLVHIPEKYLTQKIAFVHETPKQREQFIRLIAQGLCIFLAIFVLNVWLYSRWTARKITNPLIAIADGIRHVTDSRYEKRLELKAYDELMQIQGDFNRMAERLERTEREKRQLEESRQRMLLDISHDLKTPITTIQGYAEALRIGIVEDKDSQKKYLQWIYDKSVLLAELVQTFFELAKLESPDYPMNKQRGDMAECVRTLAAQLYDSFEQKQFGLDLDIPERKVECMYDATLLYRALSNILMNALRHNPRGTTVRIRLRDKLNQVVIQIEDNGVGIPESLQDTIFEPFTRGDQARRSDGGAGLGLSIAKQIIDKHGGTILLDEFEGWTRFWITMPKT